MSGAHRRPSLPRRVVNRLLDAANTRLDRAIARRVP